MSTIKRNINDILFFRNDISPFLVHLTRDRDGEIAENVLKKIIKEKVLTQNASEISDARFGINTARMSPEEKKKYFGAISFTETPLGEIHCLLEVDRRQIDLKPYGFVFLKDSLIQEGVDPVIYINTNQDKADVVQSLCSLISSHSAEAAKILPLIAVFGNHITPPGASPQTGNVDFRWEREWRYPSYRGNFNIKPEQVFVGLCAHGCIDAFEKEFNKSYGVQMKFIDPMRSTKWYATQLVEARQRLGIKNSVV